MPADGEALTVESGGKLIHTAGNSITLKPGFTAEAGSNFRAEIRDISYSQMNISVSQWNNVFTPNGDGVNDELCFDVQNANTYEFQAFNSWGQLVFQSAGTISGNTACVWDGTGSCSYCAYACIIKFRNSCGEVVDNAYTITVIGGDNKKSATINSDSTTNTKRLTFRETEPNFKEIVDNEQNLINATEPLLSIYPNPTDGSFKIHVKNIELPYDVRCLNSFGKVVYERSNLFTNNYQIKLDNPSGVYVIQVNSSNNIILDRKLIINSHGK